MITTATLGRFLPLHSLPRPEKRKRRVCHEPRLLTFVHAFSRIPFLFPNPPLHLAHPLGRIPQLPTPLLSAGLTTDGRDLLTPKTSASLSPPLIYTCTPTPVVAFYLHLLSLDLVLQLSPLYPAPSFIENHRLPVLHVLFPSFKPRIPHSFNQLQLLLRLYSAPAVTPSSR